MTAKQIVDFLNDIHAHDPETAQWLVEEKRIVSNIDYYVKHPTIPVYEKYGTVRMIGFLNGIAGLDGEIIEACYDDKTAEFTGFRLRERTRDAYADAAI